MVTIIHLSKYRAVARSENPGGLVVLGGDILPLPVEIGFTDLPKTGGAKAPLAPPACDGPACFAFTPQANFPAHDLNFH